MTEISFHQNNAKQLISPKDQSAWFAAQDPKALAEWLYKAFLQDETTPLEFDLSRATLYAYIVSRIIDYRGNTSLKNIRKAIELATREWSLDSYINNPNDALKYLEFLVSLAGRLQVTSLLPKFMAWLVSRRFEAVDEKDGILMLSILRTVLGFNMKDRGVMALCKRDIYNPRYAAYCYRALWYRNPDNALKYFVHVAKLHMDFGDSVIAFPNFFKEISQTFNRSDLSRRLRKELRTCTDPILKFHITKVLATYQWRVEYVPGDVIILPPGEFQPEEINAYLLTDQENTIDEVPPNEEKEHVSFLKKIINAPGYIISRWEQEWKS